MPGEDVGPDESCSADICSCRRLSDHLNSPKGLMKKQQLVIIYHLQSRIG